MLDKNWTNPLAWQEQSSETQEQSTSETPSEPIHVHFPFQGVDAF